MKATKESYKQAIVDGGLNTFNQGLTVGNWGNISIRNPETNLPTESRLSYRPGTNILVLHNILSSIISELRGYWTASIRIQ